MRSPLKSLRYAAEAFCFIMLYTFFRGMSLDRASWCGEKLGLFMSRFLRHNHVARRNLELVFPEKTAEEREAIVRGMWKHLGRVIAEFAHLPGNALIARISFKGLENAPLGRPMLFVSAHFGQWELNASMAYEHGIPVTLVYRHINNPYIDRWLSDLRAEHSTNMFPKGHRGAAKMARALKNGESIAMLVDQKMNNGIPVKFFGREVFAAPALAQLALRYDMPIVPARVVRKGGAHFEATAYPPLRITKTGDDAADAQSITQDIYTLMEKWIREHPEQYFWVHRRFSKDLY